MVSGRRSATVSATRPSRIITSLDSSLETNNMNRGVSSSRLTGQSKSPSSYGRHSTYINRNSKGASPLYSRTRNSSRSPGRARPSSTWALATSSGTRSAQYSQQEVKSFPIDSESRDDVEHVSFARENRAASVTRNNLPYVLSTSSSIHDDKSFPTKRSTGSSTDSFISTLENNLHVVNPTDEATISSLMDNLPPAGRNLNVSPSQKRYEQHRQQQQQQPSRNRYSRKPPTTPKRSNTGTNREQEKARQTTPAEDVGRAVYDIYTNSMQALSSPGSTLSNPFTFNNFMPVDSIGTGPTTPPSTHNNREPTQSHSKQNEARQQQTYPSSTPTATSPRSERFSWRSSPSISLSDWEIRILRKKTGFTDVYHVHRMKMGVGDRRSEYFEKQFIKYPSKQRKNPKQQQAPVSKLEMSENAADLFPVVLDYIYGHDELLDVLKDQADSFRLYSHAEYFEISGLRSAVADWFRAKVPLTSIPNYLSHAKQFRNKEPLVAVAIEVCADKFHDMSPELAGSLRPWIFFQVLEAAAAKQNFKNQSGHAAELIMECCQNYDMEKRDFDRITCKTFLPTIESAEIAMKLMLLDSELVSVPEKGERGQPLDCLQSRCVDCLAKDWEKLGVEFDSHQAMVDCLTELSPRILAEVLIQRSKFSWKS